METHILEGIVFKVLDLIMRVLIYIVISFSADAFHNCYQILTRICFCKWLSFSIANTTFKIIMDNS
jgi:hypothetical protein